jgi:hypothetical protein
MPEEELKEEDKVEESTPEVSKPEEKPVPKKKSKLPLLLGVFGVLILVCLGIVVWKMLPHRISYDSNSEMVKYLDGEEKGSASSDTKANSDSEKNKEPKVLKSCKEILNFENGKFILNDCNYKTVGGPYNIDRNFAILTGKNIEELQFIDIYSISNDNQRIFIGNLPKEDVENALMPIGGSFSVEPKMLDLKTGELIELKLPGIEGPMPMALITKEVVKNAPFTGKETAWSPDNKGVALGIDGSYYYCSDRCRLVIETKGFPYESPGSASYFIGSSYYYETLEDQKNIDSKVITKSIKWTP